jgi:hypothetical protein
VAVAHDCTPAHVYDECADGDLRDKHIRLGGLILVPDPVMRERLQLTDQQHQALREAIAAKLAAEAAARAKSRPGIDRRTKRRSKNPNVGGETVTAEA